LSTDSPARTALYDELLRRFASGVRAAQLYAAEHPLLSRNIEGLISALAALHQHAPSVPVGIVGNELVVADTPMARTSAGMAELIKRLRDHKIERIAFERGVTAAEAGAFVHAVAALGSRMDSGERMLQSPHIRVGRITADDRQSGGIVSDMAAIRQLYTNAVQAAETAWDSAEQEGTPDMPAALQTVEGLADAVSQNRTALMARCATTTTTRSRTW
jgi:hypothetical protein